MPTEQAKAIKITKKEINYVNERLEMSIDSRPAFTHEVFSQIWEKLSDKQKGLVTFKDESTTDVILNDLPRAFKKVIYALEETDTELVISSEDAYGLLGFEHSDDKKLLKEWEKIEENNTDAKEHYAWFIGIYKRKKTGKLYEMGWMTISGMEEIHDDKNGFVTLHEVVPKQKTITEYVRK